MKTTWADIARGISVSTGRAFRIEQHSQLTGGCINAAWTVAGRGQRYFVKLNDPARAPMFEAEIAGLAELLRAGAVRAPQPVYFGANATASWLVLEFIDLRRRTAESDAMLGAQLAELHRRHDGALFGWTRDNTIGSTPQRNAQSVDWPAFWRDQRLGFQLELAGRNGYAGRLPARGEMLLQRVPAFFSSHQPAPSLLHGDLWSGNAACDESGAPVLFDPAVYCGDREADIAMTELFGGYSARFHAAYRDAYPLDAGYEVRRDLYNLYHVLNHLNLFGGSYLQQDERMIDKLLAQSA